MIPLIDLSTLHLTPTQWSADLTRSVDAAARHLGFMQVTGHGIPAHTLQGLQRAMDGFFAQPLVAKQRWRAPSPAINRGYTSPLSERLSYSAGVASVADLFEAFNVGAACSDFPYLPLDAQTYPENIWPDVPPGFREAVQAWFEEAGRLARRLTRLFAVTLGLPEHHFEPYEDHSIDVLRLNHYAMPTDVETLPTCRNEAGAAREPITVAEHLRRKLAGSRGLQLNAGAQQESARILRGAQQFRPQGT